jgi:hypothetical protein
MTREEAQCMVFDLLDAARAYDRAETGFRRDARESYEEMRTKVINALHRPFYGAQCGTYPNCRGGCGLGCTKEHEPEPRTGAGSLD